jgi:hypothetical protein
MFLNATLLTKIVEQGKGKGRIRSGQEADVTGYCSCSQTLL